MNIREALRSFLGSGSTEQQIKDELEQIKLDNLLDTLHEGGFLSADEDVRKIAAEFAKLNPDGLEKLLKSDRPIPASVQVKPANGPDATESAIQRVMSEQKLPYHEAARQVSTGEKTIKD